MDDTKFMRMAIKKATVGIGRGQAPFGACIVLNGKKVAVAHNRVWADLDITAHAEMVAIRKACRALGTIDLTGSVIYSTCEPCPMCFSACHWAGISRIVYGAEIQDAKDFGFNELFIPSQVMSRFDRDDISIKGGMLREDCVDLFKTWSLRRDKRVY